MATFISSKLNTDRGNLSSYQVDDRKVYLFSNTTMTNHPIIGEALQSLFGSITATGEFLEGRASDLTAIGFAKLATETVTARIKPTFNAARTAVAAAEANLDERSAVFSAPYFTADQPPAVRVELRQFARSLPLPKLMDAIQSDPSLAGAVVEGGLAMSCLPADIFDRLKRDVSVANATRVLSGQRNFRTTPDANDPIGGKIDSDAAQAAGEALIESLEAERTLLSEAPTALASAIDAVAIMTDTTRDAAFNLMAA